MATGKTSTTNRGHGGGTKLFTWLLVRITRTRSLLLYCNSLPNAEESSFRDGTPSFRFAVLADDTAFPSANEISDLLDSVPELLRSLLSPPSCILQKEQVTNSVQHTQREKRGHAIPHSRKRGSLLAVLFYKSIT